MRNTLAGASWRLAVFSTACIVALIAVFAVFGQLRFQPETAYAAEFSDVSGLKGGDFVRIAGVEVGKVTNITVRRDGLAVVRFSADGTVVLTAGSKAVIRYADLIGGRYLALEEGAGGVAPLPVGATIPLDRTQPALDLDALIGGFRPLFRALDPEQVNTLTGQLISAFQDQGVAIGSFLAHTASLTNTLADRDELIGQVIDNLNGVLASLGDESDQFSTAIAALAELVKGLAARKTDLTNAMAYGNEAARSIADLLDQARAPLHKTIHETQRSADIVVADHAYFDDLLNTLPDAYQALARQGLYGDYFAFYICEVLLKLNGKGGQPVYIKLVGQRSGRCTPR
jgi:phospholipid/cholesterol/gamma-HCH transport system substrate-binding protein